MHTVLIVVFDGLQPAQVHPGLMPHLSSFAGQGVTFANHHPVFPTVTRANAATMVTGRTPGGHGLAANRLMVREFDPYRTIPALEPELARVKASTGRVLLVPTLADVLGRQGEEYIAIGVGTSGNAFLHNPNPENGGGATIHPDFTRPGELQQELVQRFGPWPDEAWPDEARPNTPRMAHAVRILTEYILPERQPRVALIWSSEPDKSQHDAGVGSDLSNQAVQEADAEFGRLLHWLSVSGRARETDVMVVSDHGYSTIAETIDVEAALRQGGFPAADRPGGVAVAGNGGSALFYTHNGDPSVAADVAEWLMGQPWCGPVVVSDAAGPLEGTLPAWLAGDEGPRVPEVSVSLQWNAVANPEGYTGHVISTGGAPGQGQHGSMSRQELHNVLFARGPNFKKRCTVAAPSGNADLFPTVLHLLGIESPAATDGRVLSEALSGGPRVDRVQWGREIYNAERELHDRVFRQQIHVSLVGDVFYVDQGSSTLGRR
jgi:arylsulfatase A-like enzyme